MGREGKEANTMNDEDRGLIRRALDVISGANSDPVRSGLQTLIDEHGRESVAKAAGDLDLTEQFTAEELEAINAALAGGESESTESESTDPLDARLTKIEQTLDKLANGNTGGSGESQGEQLPEDELALVKSGVPVDLIESARPMLRSTDEQARKSAFEFLGKQANPQRAALLAKERGSSQIVDADDATKADYKARLAKQNGEQPRQTAAEQLLAMLRDAS